MANTFFKFKSFTIYQDKCAMKVSTDGCLFGAWVASKIKHTGKLLDIGAGTGLLSLMIAQKHSFEIDAVEIEETCHEQLTLNIENSQWGKTINPIHKDILTHTISGYHVIISNPPFYEKQLASDKHEINLARHETGLQLKSLFEKANELLEKNGYFYLLMPFYRKKECLEIAEKNGFYPSLICDVKQSLKHDFFRVFFCFSKHKEELFQEEIAIIENGNTYTNDFTDLLKGYYLYL